jgi:hypothetical protein
MVILWFTCHTCGHTLDIVSDRLYIVDECMCFNQWVLTLVQEALALMEVKSNSTKKEMICKMERVSSRR